MKKGSKIAGVAAIGACVGLALLYPLGCTSIPITEDNVFQPKRSVTPAQFSHPRLTLEVHPVRTPDGVVLDAWHLSQPDARATVLFFGGQGFYLVQSIEYIEAFAELGLDVFLWDYRGYGKSEGTPTVENVKADALTIYDYATQTLGVSADRVIVHGHSLGSFPATHVTTQRKTVALVLENPVSSVERWTESLIPTGLNLVLRLEPKGPVAGETNIEGVRAFTGDLLVVGGSKDVIAHPEMAQTLHEAANQASFRRLVIVSGGEHNGLYETEGYVAGYRALLDRRF